MIVPSRSCVCRPREMGIDRIEKHPSVTVLFQPLNSILHAFLHLESVHVRNARQLLSTVMTHRTGSRNWGNEIYIDGDDGINA